MARVTDTNTDEALLLQSQIAGLKQPNSRVFEAIKHFFERPHHILGGKAKSLFDDNGDMVTLKPSQETDMLSNFLREHWRDEVTCSPRVLRPHSLTRSRKKRPVMEKPISDASKRHPSLRPSTW